MLEWLGKLFKTDRRGAVREPRGREAHLFAGATPLSPVLVIDRSSTGVRVQFSKPCEVGRASRLLVIAGAELLDVEPVWANASQAAFRITASCHLRGYTEGEDAQIKAWWVAHRSVTG